jgi:hypothetical protein
MASLGKQTPQRATHPKDCKEFAALTSAVETALAYGATPPAAV